MALILQDSCTPSDDTHTSWKARLPFRNRRRFLFLATAFAAISLLYSSHLLLGEHFQVPRLTVTITQTSPSTTGTVVVEPPVQPVVFSLIMISEQSAQEGLVLLKSAIMYTSRPLQFHIICDEAAQTLLETRFRLLTRPLHSISVRFYRLSFQSMLERVLREGSIHTGHSAGIPGLMKLFMHELLPEDVENAIYVDTDAFFLTDPALLWEEFSNWNSSVSVSMPYHPNRSDQACPLCHDATRICSCIMLLRFARFRAQRLMDSSIYREDHSGLFPPALSPPTFEALFGPPGPDGQYINAPLGDQSYWWAIVSNRTELFRPLSYDWEVTSCLMDMYNTGLGHDDVTEDEERGAMANLWGTPYQGQVVLPKLLHFNCLHDIFYLWDGWSKTEDYLSYRWKAAVDYHVGFKWLWLNRGDGNSAVDMQTIIEPLFADQRFAAEHTNEQANEDESGSD